MRDAVRYRVVALVAATLAMFCLSQQIAAAAVDRSRSFEAVKVDKPPAFDSALNDPAWQKAVAASDFRDLTTRRPAPLRTTAYVLYDDTNIYVAFHAEQDGVPIHAEQTTNDVGFGQDDAVGVGIDPSGAGSQVYFFEATPRGVRYQQSNESTRYAPVWHAEAAISGSSWNAMFTIPLKSLRASGGKNKTWRFNFIRVVAGVGEHYTWAYDGLMQDNQPPNWPAFTDARFWPALGGMQIAQTARPQPRAEIYGLASIGHDRNVFLQANNTFATQSVRNFGIDLTYPITSTIAAVGTLNPDFSNVEVDQQTIVPQEFRRNLTEYRSFFAQGAQFFNPNAVQVGGFINPPNQIFYTPSIGTFDRGIKVEGTFGQQAIGALEVRGRAADGSILDDQAFGFKHALSDRTFLYWFDGVFAHHGFGPDPALETTGDDSAIETGFGGRNLTNGLVYGFDQVMDRRQIINDPFAPNDRGNLFAYQRNGFIDVHKPNYEWYYGYQDLTPNFGPLDSFTTINDARGSVYTVDFAGSNPGLKTYDGFYTVDRLLKRDGTVHAADFLGNLDFTTNQLIHLTLQQQTSSLDDPVLTGGVNLPFHQSSATLGYRDGTPAPTDLFYAIGPFGGFLSNGVPYSFYLQQFNLSATRPLGTRFNLQLTYAGTHERSQEAGVNGQLLRSIALGESFGSDMNATLALRSINGNGGFALPGVNLAVGFHSKFRSGSELFVNYGTPAAPATLNRLIVKYLLRIGGGAGT
jgi:hypothetical protein